MVKAMEACGSGNGATAVPVVIANSGVIGRCVQRIADMTRAVIGSHCPVLISDLCLLMFLSLPSRIT